MKLRFTFPVVALLAVAGMPTPAQLPTLREQDSSFSGQTSNVLVPALVRDSAGSSQGEDPAYFRVSDHSPTTHSMSEMP